MYVFKFRVSLDKQELFDERRKEFSIDILMFSF